MDRESKLGLGALAAVAVACALLGYGTGTAIANATQRSAIDEALTELRGTGNVPGTASGQESSGSFIPSDQPPACLPNGTVTYEIYDEAANVRYWVFRWPENGGYSVVPRFMIGEGGRVVRYQPPEIEIEESEQN